MLATQFRRPMAFLRFSKWIVVTNNGMVPGRALELRIMNELGDRRPVLDARVSLVLSWTDRVTGQREHHALSILEEKHPELPTVVTVTYPISRRSLLAHHSWDDLMARNTQLWCFLRGFDALTSREITLSHQYDMDRFLISADFEHDQLDSTLRNFDTVRAVLPINRMAI